MQVFRNLIGQRFIRAVFTVRLSFCIQYNDTIHPESLQVSFQELLAQLTTVFCFYVNICTHLSGTFNRPKKTFGFRRFIIMGIGGALHFDIVYNLHHSFLCFCLFRIKEIKQCDCNHTDSNQTADQLDSFFVFLSLNIQDHPPPDTSGDHPDIFQRFSSSCHPDAFLPASVPSAHRFLCHHLWQKQHLFR